MADKRLEIMNVALDETGNNQVETATEVSDENRIAGQAYDRYLPILLEAHPWNFSTLTDTLDQETENPSQRFKYAYAMPAGALYLKAVFHNRAPIEYEIVSGLICANFEPSQYPLVGEYVAVPAASVVSNRFFDILTLKVKVACLRGLNEDFNEARLLDREAEQKLLDEQSRTDRQATPRAPMRSASIEARRGRRGVRCHYRQ